MGRKLAFAKRFLLTDFAINKILVLGGWGLQQMKCMTVC